MRIDPVIQIEKLILSFGSHKVLHEVELPIAEKQITALIGPSGCGKSTLLRSLNRMHDLSPDARLEGKVLLEGKNILEKGIDVTELRRKVGMVFQKPNPFPKSIHENIAYGLRINGITNRKEIEARVEQSLRDSFLWEEVKDQLSKSALQLSGGQQQRLCIARTIAVKPEVILMDEPCSALDPISTAKVEELMLRLKQDFTLVVVTHNMQQAQRIADLTAVMYLGKLIEYGQTKQVFQAPKKDITRNYISGSFG